MIQGPTAVKCLVCIEIHVVMVHLIFRLGILSCVSAKFKSFSLIYLTWEYFKSIQLYVNEVILLHAIISTKEQHKAISYYIYSWYSANIVLFLGKSWILDLLWSLIKTLHAGDSSVISPVHNTRSLLAGRAVFQVLSSFVASPTRITESKFKLCTR